MAVLSFNPTSGFNTNNQFPGSSQNNSLLPPQTPELNEVFLGQIVSQVVFKATVRFDDPITTQGGGVPSNSPQLGSSNSNNPPQAQPRLGNQFSGSSALTKEGGLSFGGGFRLGGAGAPMGVSGVGTTTINGDGYQTSGGISVGGISANAGIKLNRSGLSFSGGIGQAQIGQGIVGSKVGPKIVGP